MIELNAENLYAIAVILAILLIPTALLRSGIFSDINQRKRTRLANEYIKDLESELDSYKREVRSLKNQSNAKERGPQLNGDLGDIGALLPELLPQLSNYAPGWLKPMLSNPDMQKQIGEFIQANPEKASQFLSRIVGNKKKDANSPEATISL